MVTYEGLRLKLQGYQRNLFSNFRRAQLRNTNFTIISNNCWGGMIYESYNLPKMSPTVGLFFVASDYIEFISDLKGYIYGELSFIKPSESRWISMPEISADKRFGTYPVGLLSNGKHTIEIFFLHYKDENEARRKWERRVSRINWEKLIIKFNDQNGCTEKDVSEFMRFNYPNKLFFTCKRWKEQEGIYIRQFPKQQSIMTSNEPFGHSRYINITDYINHLQ